MRFSLLAIALVAEAVTAYPFVANMPGVDSSLFRKAKRQQPGGGQKGGAATCPFNPDHPCAAPITSQYPYNDAINGLPGKGVGGYQVPAPGDTAHQFVAPGPNDIRKSSYNPQYVTDSDHREGGPCPGLNTAANHNFLSHDGIVTFNELVDA
jgi:hypothetical protein